MRFLLFLFLIFACVPVVFAQPVKVGEEFKLTNRQSAKIEGAELEITAVRIGRKWVGKQEKTDLTLSVQHGGKTEYFSAPFAKPVIVGAFEIKVVSVNPFGIENVVLMVTSEPRVIGPGAKVSLTKGDTVRIAGTDFSFTFQDIEYEVLRATSGQEIHYHRLNVLVGGGQKSDIVKDNVATIDGFDFRCDPPFDRSPIECAISTGGAPANARDAAAAKFVEKFGWHLDEVAGSSSLTMNFPKDFSGLPFAHYYSASKASGLDMTTLAGKTANVWGYLLKEKSTARNREVTNTVHLIFEGNRVIAAWRTDSSDAAPGIYSMIKR